MVQEIIPGPDTSFYSYATYINSENDVSARFFRRKIRQNPTHFGVARVAISQDRIPIIEEFAERILKQADFRGFASAEFKKDSRDDQFKLIEINVRMLRTIWHPTYCGVNFPWIIYMDLVENKRLKVNDYKKNVYWIELYQDIANFIKRRKMENLGFKDYVRPYLSKNKTFADLSMEDPMPFLKRLSHWPIRRYRYFRWGKNRP
jgi:predicted ATP-grasp superfamily ATP-dependent carboligase